MDIESKIINTKGNMILVEVDGEIQHRYWVTKQSFEDGDDPRDGIPASSDFSILVNFAPVSPTDLDRELKRRNIWTTSDVLQSPDMVKAALQTVYGVSLASVLEAAQKFEKEIK